MYFYLRDVEIVDLGILRGGGVFGVFLLYRVIVT